MAKLIDFYLSQSEWEKKTALSNKWYVRGKPFTHTLFHDEGDVATLPKDCKLVAVGDVDQVQKNLKKFYFSSSEAKDRHASNFREAGRSSNTYANSLMYTFVCDAEQELISAPADVVLVLTAPWDDVRLFREDIVWCGNKPDDMQPEDCFDLRGGDDYDDGYDDTYRDDQMEDRRRFDAAWPDSLTEDGDKFDEDV
jgi:hypothetical protein